MLTVKVSFDMTDAIVKRRGIENFGPVHNRINNIILSYCEPYIPKRSGALIASGKSGVGSVSWACPMQKQYYEKQGARSSRTALVRQNVGIAEGRNYGGGKPKRGNIQQEQGICEYDKRPETA
ncbi:MAG: minor capsid protein [Clostridiales bacterium]|nr:MAG: minor capsid protein [Clostridiales bacterium]